MGEGWTPIVDLPTRRTDVRKIHRAMMRRIFRTTVDGGQGRWLPGVVQTPTSGSQVDTAWRRVDLGKSTGVSREGVSWPPRSSPGSARSRVSPGTPGTRTRSRCVFTFTHHLDKASPSLMKACATGVHVKDATITVRKATKEG